MLRVGGSVISPASAPSVWGLTRSWPIRTVSYHARPKATAAHVGSLRSFRRWLWFPRPPGIHPPPETRTFLSSFGRIQKRARYHAAGRLGRIQPGMDAEHDHVFLPWLQGRGHVHLEVVGWPLVGLAIWLVPRILAVDPRPRLAL